MKILLLEPENYSPQAIETYHSLGIVDFGPMSHERLLERIKEYDILVVRLAHHIDKTLLSSADKLKAIVTPTTGTDHIDLEATEKAGIRVMSLKGETTFLRTIPATAELTWGLLLALIRNIPAASGSVMKGNWDRNTFRGHELAGKTLGILGLGRIGEKTAKYGLAFGMKVIAYDPNRPDKFEGVERVSSIEELFRQSQILLIHVPLEVSTVNLIDDDLLQLLPEGAFLVNTSRGQVVHEEALIKALESGKLAGAALDVIQSENTINPSLSKLVEFARSHSNLLITPHIGGATVESMKKTEEFMSQKLANWFNQKVER